MKTILMLAMSILAVVWAAPNLTAQTATTSAGLAGDWHFVLDTPGGDRESEATFTVDGTKVTGKYGAATVAGMFEAGMMDLAFNVDTDEAGSGTLKLKGKLDGDTITGDWAFSDYNGTFKATRKAAAAAEPKQ